MTTLSFSDQFLSTSYIIKMGIALLFPIIAVIISVKQLINKNKKMRSFQQNKILLRDEEI